MKRKADSKPSERTIQCGLCPIKLMRSSLSKHFRDKHPGKKPFERGVTPISSYFASKPKVKKRKIEPRFYQYTEIDEQDRAKQEVFLHENSVALTKLPMEKLNQNWLKRHRPSLKKDSRSNPNSLTKFIQNFFKKRYLKPFIFRKLIWALFFYIPF